MRSAAFTYRHSVGLITNAWVLEPDMMTFGNQEHKTLGPLRRRRQRCSIFTKIINRELPGSFA